MPPPERMLNTLRRAIDLVKATPGRTGHLVRLQNCTEVLVAGDMHGHVPNFQAVFKAADLAKNPTRHLVLQELIHGKFRYPTGGDKSHQLVDLFAALKCQFPNQVHFLPGNHELAQWMNRPIGKSTEESLNDLFRQGVRETYGQAGADIYRAYCDLFQSLPVALRTPNDVFISHSLPPGRNMGSFDASKLEQESFGEQDFQPGGTVYSLLWGRDTSDQNLEDFLRKVDAELLISGHIPTDTGFLAPNPRQLIVDCSASPAAYVLFPADRALSHAELLQCVVVI